MDTIMKSDIMTNNELQNACDAIAEGYEQKLWFDQYILGVARQRKQLMSKARGKILDIACGTGLNFHLFAPGSDITGIDFSPGMLEVARPKCCSIGIECKFGGHGCSELGFCR